MSPAKKVEILKVPGNKKSSMIWTSYNGTHEIAISKKFPDCRRSGIPKLHRIIIPFQVSKMFHAKLNNEVKQIKLVKIFMCNFVEL